MSGKKDSGADTGQAAADVAAVAADVAAVAGTVASLQEQHATTRETVDILANGHAALVDTVASHSSAFASLKNDLAGVARAAAVEALASGGVPPLQAAAVEQLAEQLAGALWTNHLEPRVTASLASMGGDIAHLMHRARGW